MSAVSLQTVARRVADRLESWSVNAGHTARLSMDPDQADRAAVISKETAELAKMLRLALEIEELAQECAEHDEAKCR